MNRTAKPALLAVAAIASLLACAEGTRASLITWDGVHVRTEVLNAGNATSTTTTVLGSSYGPPPAPLGSWSLPYSDVDSVSSGGFFASTTINIASPSATTMSVYVTHVVPTVNAFNSASTIGYIFLTPTVDTYWSLSWDYPATDNNRGRSFGRIRNNARALPSIPLAPPIPPKGLPPTGPITLNNLPGNPWGLPTLLAGQPAQIEFDFQVLSPNTPGTYSGNMTATFVAVPEPGTWAMVLFAGVAALAGWRRRKRTV